jgi:transcriptional regulator with XRE-family HTH domain
VEYLSHMRTASEHKSFSTALRRMIADSGVTLLELEKATGVKRASIRRFLAGERSLVLDSAERLAAHFDLRVSGGAALRDRPSRVTRLVASGTVPDAQRPSFVLAHRLLAAGEGLFCPMRAIDRLNNAEPGPATSADRYYQLVAALGAAGEVVAIARGKKREGRRDLQLIAAALKTCQEPTHKLHVRLCAKPPDSIVRLSQRARSSYWAHWDPEVSGGLFTRLSTDFSVVPMAETSGGGEIALTSCKWVREAWFIDMERTLGIRSGTDVLKNTQRMMSYLRDVSVFTRAVAMSLLKSVGIRFTIQPEP